MMDEEPRLLKIELDHDWTLREFTSFLDSLRLTYNSFELFVEELPSEDTESIQRRTLPIHARSVVWDYLHFQDRSFPPEGELSTYRRIHRRYCLDEYRPAVELTVRQISLASPGDLDLLGIGRSVEAIRDLFQTLVTVDLDRRQRKLQNAILENEAIEGRIQALRGIGYTEAQIREHIRQQFEVPAEELASYADREVVIDMEVVDQSN